jgi:hypothetical protein
VGRIKNLSISENMLLKLKNSEVSGLHRAICNSGKKRIYVRCYLAETRGW